MGELKMDRHLLVLFQSLMISFCYISNICNFRFVGARLRNCYMYIFINAIIITIFLGYKRESMVIPISFFIIFMLLYYKEKESFVNVIVSLMLSFITFMIVDLICGTILINVLNIDAAHLISNKLFNIFIHVSVVTSCFFVSKVIGSAIEKHRLNKIMEFKGSKFLTFILLNIGISLVILYINAMINKSLNISNNVITLNAILFLAYFITTLFISYFFWTSIQKQNDYEKREKDFENFKEYTELLETMHNDVRAFKHDYVNILATIKEYIDDENTTNLKDFFYKSIIPLSEGISNKNTRIGLLQKIKVVGLKGLLSSKIIGAQSLNVDVFIDIAEEIDNIDIDVIELSRIIGILFDNALEAAVLCEKPAVKLGIIKKENSFIFIIINSCSGDIPSIHKMYEEGFSTKGKNRGLGLYNVKKLIKQYPNVTLNTTIENKEFCQELEIYNHEK
jgi:two-component system, LytTR family, sensor histidine kinase AgrC